MFVRDGAVYYSASDLTNAVKCEWALMRKLDAKLGRIEAVEEPEDAMLARAGILGGEHEDRALAGFVEQYGDGVVTIAKPRTEPEALREAMAETVAALNGGADVVFQGTFFADGFLGFADFLIRTGETWEVYDTKLARKARITALLQVAAYSEQLQKLDIPVGEHVHLLLGDGTTSTHRLADIAPVYSDRVARLKHMLDERMAAPGPIAWGEPGYSACGRCAECAVQVTETRDVLLVAGMRTSQRVRLAAAGILSIDDLADSSGPVDGIGDAALAKLRDQARMQLDAPAEGVAFRVHDAAGLASLPAPDQGDIFFDFEGDPLWTADGLDWGIDYLWGVIDHDGQREHFLPFWAHDRAQERQALIDFLEYVRQRRQKYPGMHIYHYADYERSHLQALCARYGTGEGILDDLLREHVLVDLYPIVKRSIRVSTASYSLKKLEPLYMGSELRTSTVANGADSIQAYVDWTLLVAAGEVDEAATALAEIEDYNRYDCVSTLRLRDWLLARADEAGIPRRAALPVEPLDEKQLDREEDAVRDRLYSAIDGIPAADRDADQTALALAAAAIEYHRREDKNFWWEHFNRQVSPIDDWAEQRGVFVVESAEVASEWQVPVGRRVAVRLVRLVGRLAPGSRLGIGDRPFVMYADPAPEICGLVPDGQRGEHDKSNVREIAIHGDLAVVVLEESAGMGGSEWDALPVALTPGSPIPTKAQRQAILEWGRGIAEGNTTDASFDLLRRRPPRGILARGAGAESIVASLLTLDHSYLAVQGPPGSGKTFVGAQVIATLVVQHGWKVGVVAQSHEVVDNLLRGVLKAGMPAAAIAKKAPSGGYPTAPDWAVLESTDEFSAFVRARRSEGYVLGGTSWDFANGNKVPRGELDLLVIDEAGQFSLANTIAVGVSAARILLLGDPQQLPQVSQGMHPEPVDESALGWLSNGHDVLPDELGYFLAETWRMHPSLTAAVSDLAYEGRLGSHLPETVERELSGIEPGLHPVPVQHYGNSTSSPEEAERVVDLVKEHLGRPWTDAALGRTADPLRPSDVIVVAPYNAQVDLLRAALDDAGLNETPVGTVDKFQGQEAVIAIVSLTASSADDVPRGIGFLLLRNRLNVAISRAKWAAYLVHSPTLRDYLPHTPTGLAELSGFIRLVG